MKTPFLPRAVVGVGIWIGTAAAFAQAQGVTFKGSAEVPGAVDFVQSFSPDKLAATVLFRNMETSVSQRGPLTATRVLTLSIPLENQEKTTHLTQDLRGYVEVQGNARAVLIVQAGGQTTIVDLKKATENPGDRPAESANLKKAKELAKGRFGNVSQRSDFKGSADFFTRVPGVVPAGASYQITFILLTERDQETPEAAALLTIDSLDIAFRKTVEKCKD